MAEWKDFEQLITKIYAAATPNAKVCHDEKIVGKSGTERQIDVSISARVGLHNVLIIVECKHHNRRIGIGRVGEFYEKMEDVQASQGVMVSSRGFTKDARQSAKRHGITLLSYRAAEASDWSVVSDPASWARLITRLPADQTTWAITGSGKEILVCDDSQICSPTGTRLLSVKVAKSRIGDIGDAIAASPPGWFRFDIEFEEPVCISTDGQLHELLSLQIRANIQAFSYVINAPLASGHILERAPDGKPLYRGFTSQGFKLSDVINTQAAHPLSPEEYAAMMPHTVQIPKEFMVDHALFRYRIQMTSSESESLGN